ncbi:MAG: hypothetical protein IT211_13095 [Armatimonadetes bacterium]|nr:hypothetical protein [Armatimonadota bacterium]
MLTLFPLTSRSMLRVLAVALLFLLAATTDADAQRRGGRRNPRPAPTQPPADTSARRRMVPPPALPQDTVRLNLPDTIAQQPPPLDSAQQARQDSLYQAEQDSLWKSIGLDSEGPDMNDLVDDLIKHYSHGWFPQAFAARSLSFTALFPYADVYDHANDIRSSGFVPTTAPFNHGDPYSSGEREIQQPNQNKEIEDAVYPVTNFSEYGFSFTLNLPMPAILRADAALQIADGVLFSNDTTRSYLTLAGNKGSLKEVNTLFLNQYAVAGKIGISIPFYGVFLVSEAVTIGSYYYLNVGVSGAYTVSSKATQYVQLANVKEDLRYGNGMDTLTLMDQRTLNQLDRVRTGAEVALGWNVSAEFGTFFFEAFLSRQLNSVLKDADWKQYYVGFRLGIGYQWLPE